MADKVTIEAELRKGAGKATAVAQGVIARVRAKLGY